MSQNQFVYVRPLTDREIRLIRLLPGSFDAPIHCELFEASLDDAELQYQAISYAWGDASITQCIECNGLDVDVTVSLGTARETPIYPREVIRRALELGATALILAHNHPSGDPTPSRADIDMTAQIEAAAKALGLVLHDHLIIGRERELKAVAEAWATVPSRMSWSIESWMTSE